MARNDALFQLRLPEHLRQKLEKAAGKKKLSLTAEILNRLEESFSNEPDRIIELMERVSKLEKAVFFNKGDNNKPQHPFTKYRNQDNMAIEDLAYILGIKPETLRQIEAFKKPVPDKLISTLASISDPSDEIFSELEKYTSNKKK